MEGVDEEVVNPDSQETSTLTFKDNCVRSPNIDHELYVAVEYSKIKHKNPYSPLQPTMMTSQTMMLPYQKERER